MELKEYIEIFKKRKKIFLGTIGVIVVVGMLGYFLTPEKYKVSVDLNITRMGYQKDTNEYRYDEFYRLQADERFADTVVRWLGSARVKEDLKRKSQGVEFDNLKAGRLSSQMITVRFLVDSVDQAQSATSALTELLNEKTKELNKYQQNPNWFTVLVSRPVVSEYKWSPYKFFGVLLLSGFLVAFWITLAHYYLGGSKK